MAPPQICLSRIEGTYPNVYLDANVRMRTMGLPIQFDYRYFCSIENALVMPKWVRNNISVRFRYKLCAVSDVFDIITVSY